MTAKRIWTPHHDRKFAKDYRARYAIYNGKFRHECKACGELFYTYRPDAQTCSARCRKAFSRSPAGHLARLRRLGRDAEIKKAIMETQRDSKAWRIKDDERWDSMKRVKTV